MWMCKNSNFDSEKIDCKCHNCDYKYDNCDNLGEGWLWFIIVLLVLILIAIAIAAIFSNYRLIIYFLKMSFMLVYKELFFWFYLFIF